MHEVRLVHVQMRRSTVIGASGDSIQDSIRTSYGAFLPRRHDSTVTGIEDRLAAWTQLPMTHQEDLQASAHSCPQHPSMTCTMLTHAHVQEEMTMHRACFLPPGEPYVGCPGQAEGSNGVYLEHMWPVI